MVKDLTVILEDRPGMLAAVGEALGDAGINIEGAAVFPCQGKSVTHTLVDDAAAARKALEDAGMNVEAETDVIVVDVSVEDRPGTLGRIARTIADAGVNIDFAYMASGSRDVFATSDNDKARAALGA
jgi:hypothetical protein